MALADHQKLYRALISLRPGAVFALQGDTYADLIWQDAVAIKPTQAEVDAEIARLAALDTTEATRVAALRADPGRLDLLQRLKTATPAQIDTYVDNNVTTVAGARALFKLVLKAIALDQRS